MRVPLIKLYLHDFAILVDTIDAYFISLRIPEVYPEHANQYVPILQQLRFMFVSMSMRGKAIDLLLTEPQIIALDEAVQGFIRVCERNDKGKEAYPRTIATMQQFHQWLEQLKLPPIGQ